MHYYIYTEDTDVLKDVMNEWLMCLFIVQIVNEYKTKSILVILCCRLSNVCDERL